jgi:hypothetical protein
MILHDVKPRTKVLMPTRVGNKTYLDTDRCCCTVIHNIELVDAERLIHQLKVNKIVSC